MVDADQNYIWERGNRDLKYSIDTEDADTEQLRQHSQVENLRSMQLQKFMEA